MHVANKPGPIKTHIISDSTCRTLKNREIVKYADQNQEETTMTYHPNATAKEINHYVKYRLQQDCPDNLIVVACLNDVLHHPSIKDTSPGVPPLDPMEVAKGIINIGKDAQKAGVARICISELIRPKFEIGRLAVEKVNEFLREQCTREGFVLISQGNISRYDLGDAIHVNNFEGTDKLRENVCSQFYTYRPIQSSNFRRDRG